MTTALAERPQTQPERTEVQLFKGENPGDPPLRSIVKYHKDGRVLRAMRTFVTLSEGKGHVYRLYDYSYSGSGDHKRPHISVTGYDLLNKYAGLSIVPPRTILDDDGNTRPNPYLERDPKRPDDIKRVRVQMVGVGMDVTGSLVFHSVTLSYDLITYARQALWKKWRPKKGGVGKDWGILLPPGAKLPKQAEGQWRAYDLEDGNRLWVNLTHPDVLDLLGERNNQAKFAERNAISICRRNVYKAFLAAVKLDESLTVAVDSWVRTDRDLHEMAQLAADSASGHVVVDGTPCPVVADVVEPTTEDVEVAMQHEDEAGGPLDEEQPDSDASVDPAPPKRQTDPAVAALRARIVELGADADIGGRADGILGEAGIEGLAEVGTLANVQILTTAKEALERAKLEAVNARKKHENGAGGKQQKLGL